MPGMIDAAGSENVMMRFKTISELHQVQGYPPPHNPLLGLKVLKSTSGALKNMELSCDFYFISFKKLKTGNMWYGKTKYDHDRGFMFFLKPGQVFAVHDVTLKGDGFSIEIHEDFLLGHPLFAEIQKYSFFDYEINEALHLSPREEEIMWSLFRKMETEYNNNPDEFSKSIILSHLDSILKYAQRFYRRQFLDRKPLSGMTVTKFNERLSAYFQGGDAVDRGLPTVGHLASELNVSPKYLSDLLKQETGKTGLELIHLYVIAMAKDLLVAGEHNVSEIAYRLGFQNPPHFPDSSRKKSG